MFSGKYCQLCFGSCSAHQPICASIMLLAFCCHSRRWQIFCRSCEPGLDISESFDVWNRTQCLHVCTWTELSHDIWFSMRLHWLHCLYLIWLRHPFIQSISVSEVSYLFNVSKLHFSIKMQMCLFQAEHWTVFLYVDFSKLYEIISYRAFFLFVFVLMDWLVLFAGSQVA